MSTDESSEPERIAAFARRLIVKEFGQTIDPARIFAPGLSSGGAMASMATIETCDTGGSSRACDPGQSGTIIAHPEPADSLRQQPFASFWVS